MSKVIIVAESADDTNNIDVYFSQFQIVDFVKTRILLKLRKIHLTRTSGNHRIKHANTQQKHKNKAGSADHCTTDQPVTHPVW